MDCLPDSINRTKAVFVFGRFQPPTIGHAILLRKLEEKIASGEYDGYICLSKTKNVVPARTTMKGENKVKFNQFTRNVRKLSQTKENRNPLSAEIRIKFLKKMFPETPVKFINGETCGYTSRIFIDRLKALGYTDITLLIGSDRVGSFDEFAQEVWIEKVGEERTFDFDKGKEQGISGTIMREAAIKGDFNLFRRGCKIGAMDDNDVKDLMDAVRLGLGFTTMLRKVRVEDRRNKRFLWPSWSKKTLRKKNVSGSMPS